VPQIDFTLSKTVGMSSPNAGKLLDCLLRDTAKETIDAVKLNCAEDRRVRWTTYQNLEVFLVKYGFANQNDNNELVFEDGASSRIINMDETCIFRWEQWESRRTACHNVL
jgi:hypothetical protein